MDINSGGSGSDESARSTTDESNGNTVLADRPVTRAGAGLNEALAPLAGITAQVDSALAPLKAATAPLQETLVPLEAIGKKVVAYIGAALLFVGVFLTVRTFDLGFFKYSQNLWDAYGWAAALIMLSAVVGAAAAAVRMYAWLWVAAVVSLVALLIPFLGVLFDGNWSIGWGWIVLIIGWLVFGASAIMRDTRSTIT